MRAFRPEGFAPNCCRPRTLRLAQDYFSPAQWLVILAITTSGPKELCTRNDEGSWRVRGMSYGLIAARAGVCWKTARNAIRRGVMLGLIRVFERTMRGKRRVSTTYTVESFSLFLAAMRAKLEYFHVAGGHVIGIGRNPRIATAADAEVWKINPNAPPAPRSAGPITPASRNEKREPHPMDLEHVMDALRRGDCTVSDRANAAKAIETAQCAWTEAGEAGEMPGDTIAAFVSQIAKEYKPNAQYPKPALGWFIKFLPLKIKARARPRSRTG